MKACRRVPQGLAVHEGTAQNRGTLPKTDRSEKCGESGLCDWQERGESGPSFHLASPSSLLDTIKAGGRVGNR
jgi:hypothetical protein